MPKDDLSVSLHDHLIKLLEDHERLQDEQLARMDTALVIARKGDDEQFHRLNELRKEVLQDRGVFLTIAVYEARHEAIRVEIQTVHRALDDVNGNFKVWGSIVVVLSVIFQLLLHMFWK